MELLTKKDAFTECKTPWEEDKLDRQTVADYLTPIIGSIRKPFVISLNAPYGTGKSFFIKNWQKQLEDDGYKAIYFNAWKTDYAEDALIAFISSIKDQINLDNDNEKTKKLDELFAKAKPYINRRTLPVVAKILFRALIGSKAVEDIVDLPDNIDNELTSLIGDFAGDTLSRHEDIQKSIKGFREFLKELVIELTQDTDNKDKKKLIIFVDELDRCRPTYAIEILECIKHLFNVEGLVFILAVDVEQLRSTVSSVYGLKDTGEGYLRKFIDWQLNLPKPSAYKYAEFMFNSFNLEETGKFTEDVNVITGRGNLTKMIGMLANTYNLSLRQITQIFTDINLYVRSIPAKHLPFSYMLGFLSVMRHVIPINELRAYCLGEISCEPLLEKIGSKIPKEEYTQIKFENWDKLKPLLHAMFLTNETWDDLKKEHNAVIKKMNEASNNNLRNQDTIANEKRHNYIEKIFEIFQNFIMSNVDPSGIDCFVSSVPSVPFDVLPSIAGHVYKELEKAFFLTEDVK